MSITVEITYHKDGEQSPFSHFHIAEPALQKVRFNFNPSGNEHVTRAKAVAAALIELIDRELEADNLPSDITQELLDARNFAHCAQMKLVGAITARPDPA